MPVFAQEPSEIDKLRATIEQLQKTVADLQQRIKELESDKAKRDAALQQTAEKPLVTDDNTMSDQQVAAPRIDNVPIDPDLKGFIPIPGTASMFKIGGSARVDTIYDTDDNGVPNWFQPSSMPVEGDTGYESGGRTALHAKGTRISAEFRRPLGTSDRLRIFYENDFFGDASSSTMTYRMRHFYGQASNFLVGQTYSGFENVDSWPDVVDYLGPNSIVNKRQAQIRYTRPVQRATASKQSVYLSAEVPSTEVNVKNDAFPDGTRAVNRLPDFVAGYRIERRAHHVQLAAIGRLLTVENEDGASLSTTGWGINLSGAVNVLKGDKFSYQLVYGEGIARYLNDTNGMSLDAAPQGDGIDAIPILAPVIGYGHRWSDRLRSTVSYSFVDVDAPGSTGLAVIDRTDHASVNLIYQPTKQFRLGLEYMHGDKKIVSGAKGDADRFDLVVRYDLVK